MDKVSKIMKEYTELSPSELSEVLSIYGKKFKVVSTLNKGFDEILGTTIELEITERSATEKEKFDLEKQITDLQKHIKSSIRELDVLKNQLKVLR